MAEKVARNKRELIKDLPISKQWNDEKPIDKFRAGSEYVAEWKCREHGHTWKMAIFTRTSNGGEETCPFCSNQRVWTGFNDVSTKYPELLEEWNDERDPSTVLANGAYKAQWKCKNHGHIFRTSVVSRTIHLTGCPYCGRRRLLKGFNDFKTSYPEVAKEWDYDKNKITPDSFILNCTTSYWWKCASGHSYRNNCKSRALQNQNCPYCSGRQILTGFNDLATNRPQLMKDWDFTKNYLVPSKISIHRNEKAWWVCAECSHEWEALISNRSRGFGCPECSGSISKQEKELLEYVISQLPMGIKIIENDRKVIGPKEIDILIPSLRIGFEYNGTYWHDKERYNTDLLNSPEHIKTLLCKEKDIELFHIWSDEWIYRNQETKGMIDEALNRKQSDTILSE